MSRHVAKKTAGGVTERTFTANIYREDDWYVAECPELGVASQGRTIEAALGNLKQTTELYLEEDPAAADHPAIAETNLIAEVRELEQALARHLDEPVEPVDISLIETTTFTVSLAYA